MNILNTKIYFFCSFYIKKVIKICLTFKEIYNYKLFKRNYNYHTIFIIAGNRSASTWLRDLLVEILNGFSSYHPSSHPRGNKGKNYDINEEVIAEYKNKLYVTRSHTPFNLENVKIMNKYFKKYLLTVRDPRDILTSLYFHLSKKKPKESAFIDQGLTRALPWEVLENNYHKLNKDELIYQITTKIMPGVIQIMENWLDYSKKNKNILTIKYEDLIKDPVETLFQVLKFYEKDISKKKISKAVKELNPQKKNPRFTYFFIGKKGIWKELLNSKQLDDIQKISKNFMFKAGYNIT